MAWKLEYYAVTLVQRIRLDERTVVTFENLSSSLDAVVKRDQADHAPTELDQTSLYAGPMHPEPGPATTRPGHVSGGSVRSSRSS